MLLICVVPLECYENWKSDLFENPLQRVFAIEFWNIHFKRSFGSVRFCDLADGGKITDL